LAFVADRSKMMVPPWPTTMIVVVVRIGLPGVVVVVVVVAVEMVAWDEMENAVDHIVASFDGVKWEQGNHVVAQCPPDVVVVVAEVAPVVESVNDDD